MRPSGRTLGGAAAATVVAALAAPAIAFACTESPTIEAAFYNAPALTRTTVQVSGFALAPVEVHWNSVSGPVLATLSASTTSAVVTIPNVAPNVYYIVAVQNNAGSTVRASMPFEVKAPAASVASYRAAPVTAVRDLPVATRTADGLSTVATSLVALSAGVVVITAGAAVVGLHRRRVLAAAPLSERH